MTPKALPSLKKKSMNLIFQFCCLEKHKCFLLFLHKRSPNIWKIHVAATLPFLWGKKLQILYLFLIFCSLDPLWPLKLTPGCIFINTSLRNSPEQSTFFSHSLDRHGGRDSLIKRLHCKHCQELKHPLIDYVNLYALNLSMVTYFEDIVVLIY